MWAKGWSFIDRRDLLIHFETFKELRVNFSRQFATVTVMTDFSAVVLVLLTDNYLIGLYFPPCFETESHVTRFLSYDWLHLDCVR